jgi:hypothetical protein
MSYTNFSMSVGTAVLMVMFNVYFTNVLTGFDKKPQYPEHSLFSCESEYNKDPLCPEKKRKYDEVKVVIEGLEYKRHIGLLIMGILNLVIAMLVKNPLVRNALSISGLLTLVYATGTFWSKYDDKTRLGVVTLGLAIIIFMTTKYYSQFI